jgi:hypothetical protein
MRHPCVLDLIAELGFEGVDLGLFSPELPVTPAMVRENPPLWAGIMRERLCVMTETTSVREDSEQHWELLVVWG